MLLKMQRLIKFKNVSLGYNKKIILKDINFEIFKGDFLGIVGPNGVGKTTLLKAIMGLIKVKEGKILKEKDLRFGYCKQRQNIENISNFCVEELLSISQKAVIKEKKNKIEEILNFMEIYDLKDKKIKNLSGGQTQKVLIAQSLIIEPDILVLDEPTQDLDVKAEREIMRLIERIYKEKDLTIILVTHILKIVTDYTRKLLVLGRNFYKFLSSKEEILKNTEVMKNAFFS